MSVKEDFTKGIWAQNPVFRLLLGLCPTLAITTSVINGFSMGTAATFVLVCSAIIISLLKDVIPKKVRIPCFIVIIATFVTIADMLLAAYVPAIHKVLGLYIPLIVVNCIILGRMEAFASKNTLTNSISDSLGMGAGFTLALSFIGGVREILGSASFLGYNILPFMNPPLMFILPAGAFITLGFTVALMNKITGPSLGCAGGCGK